MSVFIIFLKIKNNFLLAIAVYTNNFYILEATALNRSNTSTSKCNAFQKKEAKNVKNFEFLL
jgi:predicted membrane-bound mannosyltransferase